MHIIWIVVFKACKKCKNNRPGNLELIQWPFYDFFLKRKISSLKRIDCAEMLHLIFSILIGKNARANVINLTWSCWKVRLEDFGVVICILGV